jgi:hypothetical protein
MKNFHPRHRYRGFIEASRRAARARCRGLCIRGIDAAASLKWEDDDVDAGGHYAEHPRYRCRVLIEAPSPQAGVGLARRVFHGVHAVASLKLVERGCKGIEGDVIPRH